MAGPAEATQAVEAPPSVYDVPQPLAGEIWKVTISCEADTGLVRDAYQITPHFQNSGNATAGQLADNLATNMPVWLTDQSRGHIKVYLEDFTPGNPHNPLAIRTFGTIPNGMATALPGELALCLSYFATINAPRYRGRLFIPANWIHKHQGATPSPAGARPTAGQMTAVTLFYTQVIKAALSGLPIQWVVASTVEKNAKVVTECWVDDEWDIIRSRGQRGGSRQTTPVP